MNIFFKELMDNEPVREAAIQETLPSIVMDAIRRF
jgi:hypothetical protein